MSCVVCTSLPSPRQLKERVPLSSKGASFVEQSRKRASAILKGTEAQIALFVGPCSVHDPQEARFYGEELKRVQKEVEEPFFLIMRVFVEKPRSRLGWKGIAYDPYLDGSNDLEEGLLRARQILVALNEMEVACATEFLDPLIAPYFSDCITWGMIGARTAASQPHRQLASGLPFPVGFKNGIDGDLDVAISGIITAKAPHRHFSLDSDGKVASVQTTGNPVAHLVLRGSETKVNFDQNSIGIALKKLRESHLEERVVIDCAHGNSGKNLEKQKEAFKSSMSQIREGNSAICGVMLESYLESGRQPFPEEKGELLYGLSLTDPCLGFKETEELLLEASMVMSSVQK